MKEIIAKLDGLDKGTWQSAVLVYSIKIVVGILIMLMGFWIINRVGRVINSFFGKKRFDETVKSFLKALVTSALKIVLVIFILNFIGIQTTSIVALIGAAGLAIGLALQGTLTNFAGGVMLLLFKPFRVGDVIEAQGKRGKVKDIQIFSTVLSTDEDKTIIIPNSILSNGIIENFGRQSLTGGQTKNPEKP